MLHLGIDFGTANTRISRYTGRGVPEPIAIGSSGSVSPYTMPSTCVIDSNGNILVGEQALSRPSRLKFVKRYWQARPEDHHLNPWQNGSLNVAGKVFTCEDVIHAVVGEAIRRAALDRPFTANVVCPVTFDREKRFALVKILSGLGARSVTLANVIDEPLAAAVLYGRAAVRPPVNKDLLVFDAGAGTLDLAVVRYTEEGKRKTITVIGEQGRSTAGADLDRVMESVVLQRISQRTGISDRDRIVAAYPAGQVGFEEECEQLKWALSQSASFTWAKADFLGLASVSFDVTRADFERAAAREMAQIDAAVRSVLNEARAFVDSFDGIDVVLMVGGSSKLPMLRAVVARHCKDAEFIDNAGYFDEMIATARGAGFEKDFADLVIKRPPYRTELEVRLQDGSVTAVVLHDAFEPFDWRQSFLTTVLSNERKARFDQPIESIRVVFKSPAGNTHEVPPEDLNPLAFRGSREIKARLTIRAALTLEDGNRRVQLRTPYFTQIGFTAPRPFDAKSLNLPDIYPAEN